MRSIRTWLFLLLPLALASCAETKEELVIKKDGSGTLELKMDLAKMVDMMKNFASDSDIQKQGLDKPFDTTMLLKSFIDTASGIASAKKAALRDGSIHLTLNIKEHIDKMDMAFPFKSTDQIPDLYQGLNTSASGLKELMGKSDGGQAGDKGLPQLSTVYDITVKNGIYSRKVNKERYETFKQGMNLEQLKQMGSVMGSISYTVSVSLPQPVKKTSNVKTVLSDDKKTVTLSADLLEAFEHPELLELEIEY